MIRATKLHNGMYKVWGEDAIICIHEDVTVKEYSNIPSKKEILCHTCNKYIDGNGNEIHYGKQQISTEKTN